MCTVVLVEVVRKGDRQNEIQQAFEPTQPRSAGERLIDCQKPRRHLVEVLDRGEDVPKDIIVCLFYNECFVREIPCFVQSRAICSILFRLVAAFGLVSSSLEIRRYA